MINPLVALRKPHTAKSVARRVADRLVLASLSCLCALAVPTLAAPATADAPQRTTSTYADWVVECERSGASPPRITCAMTQATQVRGKSVVFSRVMIGQPVKGKPYKFVVELPVDASVTREVRVQTKDAEPLLSAPFERCVQANCFAGIDLGEAALQKLRAASGTGKLVFVDAIGRDIAVPLSFNGLAQALDAMTVE
jgi:invasion protein IalB